MRWHDARVDPPQGDVEIFVKGFLECGTYYYMLTYWRHDVYANKRIIDYPFYATVEEIEKELDSDD